MNIVAVSAHVFHRFFVGFLFLVSTHYYFGLMSQSRTIDASGTPVPNSPMQFTSSNLGSFNGSGSDLDGMGTRSGSTTVKHPMPSLQNLYTSKCRSRKFLLSRLGCPVWIHISRKHLGILRPELQRWNRMDTFSPIQNDRLRRQQITETRTRRTSTEVNTQSRQDGS